MALGTIGLDERQNVILVSDFFLSVKGEQGEKKRTDGKEQKKSKSWKSGRARHSVRAASIFPKTRRKRIDAPYPGSWKGRWTQGSFPPRGTTLGFVTESLWDSSIFALPGRAI